MTTVAEGKMAEKPNGSGDKPAIVVRKALGRGLESLLPGTPRVLGGAAAGTGGSTDPGTVSAVSTDTPAPSSAPSSAPVSSAPTSPSTLVTSAKPESTTPIAGTIQQYGQCGGQGWTGQSMAWNIRGRASLARHTGSARSIDERAGMVNRRLRLSCA